MTYPEPVRLAALLVGLWLTGCGAEPEVRDGLDEVRVILDRVMNTGGYRCAPRQLAIANAELDFARTELDQGDLRRARQHLGQARVHSDAAKLLSPKERCAGDAQVERPSLASTGPDGDGDGVVDGLDRCPEEREDLDGFQDSDGCLDRDNDGDGRVDSMDRCPDQAEDMDGHQDEDGCPEADNDGDGVDDRVDRCPGRPGSPADEGCPRSKYQGVEVTDGAVKLSEPVVFEGSTATIRSVSVALLGTVAQALRDHPHIRIEVQGHTDSRGNGGKNLKLSQARADAVMAYLVGAGVDSTRLTARGYGETRPIESNRTSQGRAINRRVELVRTDGVH